MLTGPRYYELAIKLAIKLALGGCTEHGAERTSSLQERALYDFDVRWTGASWLPASHPREFRLRLFDSPNGNRATRTNTVDHDC